MVRGLADDHQIGGHGLERLRVPFELFLRRTSYARLDFDNGVENVFDPVPQSVDDMHRLGRVPIAQARLQAVRLPRSTAPAVAALVGDAISQRKREQVEPVFGGGKITGLLRSRVWLGGRSPTERAVVRLQHRRRHRRGEVADFANSARRASVTR